MNNDAKNFARNLRMLMIRMSDTQTTLARKAGLSQKTISNMLNPGDERSPNLENIAAIAKSYKLETWHLLYPDAGVDTLMDKDIESIIHNYVKAPIEASKAIYQVSEVTSKYQAQH